MAKDFNPTSLNTRDLQSLFKGHNLTWPMGRFYFCRWEDGASGRRLLQRLMPLTAYTDLKHQPDICVNAAISFTGMQALELHNTVLNSFPNDYRDGMAARAEINGDFGASAPETWPDYWQKRDVHIWIGVYTKNADLLKKWDSDFTAFVDGDDEISILDTQDVNRLVANQDEPVYIDDPEDQPQAPALLEHFGYRDGMGNPAIAGLNDEHVKGGGALTDKGEWQALAPGEFILGHRDSNGETPLMPHPSALARNGSFMVMRKLDQNVDLFRDYLKSEAARLGTKADTIASLMVGRNRKGVPLVPHKDDFDFRFEGNKYQNMCPMGAHMRRANPRDTFGTEFGSLLVDRHRILRRAIPYGQIVTRDKKQADVNGEEGQGLMFITLQASILRQFEFVQQQWINYGNDFDQGDDRDPIIGKRGTVSQYAMPGNEADNRAAMMCNDLAQYVTTRGGDYFFLPGIEAFTVLASEDSDWFCT